MIASALIQPEFPQAGEEQPKLLRIFIVAILIDWVFLSSVVALRFWRAGKGQRNVAGKRMKMLSIASLALSVAIVISGTAQSEESTLVEEITQVIALLSIGAFFLAFAPPEWLRAFWRRSSRKKICAGA